MKRIYALPTNTILINTDNGILHCSKKNLESILSMYHITVSGTEKIHYLELPEGWDIEESKRTGDVIIDSNNRKVAMVQNQILYI